MRGCVSKQRITGFRTPNQREGRSPLRSVLSGGIPFHFVTLPSLSLPFQSFDTRVTMMESREVSRAAK